ncbi:MAG: hypothetical protein DLM70_01120 [Chloroflexi bacterium]|nr:MAG: hypothetical protein DLM70_01120 [Chloroflexota bacterium]
MLDSNRMSLQAVTLACLLSVAAPAGIAWVILVVTNAPTPATAIVDVLLLCIESGVYRYGLVC